MDVVACLALHDPLHCRSCSVDGAEDTGEVRPGSGSLRPGEGMPGKGAVFLVLRARALFWGGCRRLRQHPPRRRRTLSEEKRAWHCVALRCSTLVAFRYSASHHLPSPRITAHHTVACLASLFLLLCGTSHWRARGAVPTWKPFFPRCFDWYVLPELPCRWK